jgi:hypothetical protein
MQFEREHLKRLWELGKIPDVTFVLGYEIDQVLPKLQLRPESRAELGKMDWVSAAAHQRDRDSAWMTQNSFQLMARTAGAADRKKCLFGKIVQLNGERQVIEKVRNALQKTLRSKYGEALAGVYFNENGDGSKTMFARVLIRDVRFLYKLRDDILFGHFEQQVTVCYDYSV